MVVDGAPGLEGDARPEGSNLGVSCEAGGKNWG